MKNISKLMLVVCVIAGAFYSTAVCAVFPVVVDAGLDKYFNAANSGANVVTTLQGSSNNPNNGIITFNWSCNGGSLSNPNASSTTFTVPYTSQKIESLAPNTQYHFRAVAQKQSNKQMYYGQDMAFYTTSDNVTVTLPPSTAPAPSASNPPPTAVSTGITDDFLKDSFFLPLLALILISWIFIVRYKR